MLFWCQFDVILASRRDDNRRAPKSSKSWWMCVESSNPVIRWNPVPMATWPSASPQFSLYSFYCFFFQFSFNFNNHNLQFSLHSTTIVKESIASCVDKVVESRNRAESCRWKWVVLARLRCLLLNFTTLIDWFITYHLEWRKFMVAHIINHCNVSGKLHALAKCQHNHRNILF